MGNITLKYRLFYTFVLFGLLNSLLAVGQSLPMTVTQAVFNNKGIIVSENGVSWSNNRIETSWSSAQVRYAVIKFEGVANSLSLGCGRNGATPNGTINVYQSETNGNWVSVFSEKNYVSKIESLKRETRYIKLEYSKGMYGAYFQNIVISKSLNLSTQTLPEFFTRKGESESRTFTVTASNLAGNLMFESNNPNFTISPSSITPIEAANGVTVTTTFNSPNNGENAIENCEISVYDSEYTTNIEKVSVVGNVIASEIQSPNINPFTTIQGKVISQEILITGTDLKGDINLNLSGENATYFSLEKSSLPSSGKLKISYLPLTAGSHSATLTLSSQYAVDVTVPISGTATDSPTNALFAPLVVTESVFNNSAIVTKNNIEWNNKSEMSSGDGSMVIKVEGIPTGVSFDYMCNWSAAGSFLRLEESPNGTDWKQIASPSIGIYDDWKNLNKNLNPRTRYIRISIGTTTLSMWVRNIVIHKNEIQSTQTEAETFRKPIGEKESVSFLIQSINLSGDLLLTSDNPNFLISPSSLSKANAEQLCGSEVTITYQPTVTGTNIGTIRLVDAGDTNRKLDIPVKGITTPVSPFRFTHSGVTPVGFTIAWEAIEEVSEYLFSMHKVVEKDTTIVEGYDSKSIMGTTISINGLEKGTQYIYKVWSKQGEAISDNPSTTQSVQTLIAPEIAYSFISEFSTTEQVAVVQNVTINGNHLQGAVALNLSGTNKEYFTISETSVADSMTVVVTFNPPAEKGIYLASLTLSSPFADDVVINLTGRFATFAGAFDETVVNETTFNSPSIVTSKSSVSWGKGTIDSGDGNGSFTIELMSAPHMLSFDCSRNKWGENNKMTVEQSNDKNKWETVVEFNPSTSWQSYNYNLKSTTRYLRFTYHAEYSAGDPWYKYCYWRNIRISKRNVQTTVRSLPQFNTTTGSSANQSFKAKGLNLVGDLSLSSSNPSFIVSPNTISMADAGAIDGVDITIQYTPTAPMSEETGIITLADSENADHTITVELSGRSQLQRAVALPADKLVLGGFSVNWETTTGAGGYYLTVHKESAPAPGLNNKWVGNVTTLDISGLEDNTTYTYEVRAALTEGSSIFSDWSIPMTVSTPPYTELLVPTNEQVSNMTTYTFFLNWSAVHRAEGYQVEIFKQGSTTPLNSIYTSTPSYQFKFATPATSYDYTIEARSRLFPTKGKLQNSVLATTLPAAETILVPETSQDSHTIWSQAFSGEQPKEDSEIAIPSSQKLVMDQENATVGALRITTSGEEIAEVFITQPMEVKEALCVEMTVTTEEQGQWMFRSFPFDVHLNTGVRLVDGKNEEYCNYWTDYRASYYDGERRAREGFTSDNRKVWIDVKAEDNYLVRGQGYIFAIAKPGTYRIYAADDTLKNVLSPGAKNVKLKNYPTERSQLNGGWNMIGSPILSRFSYSAEATDIDLPRFIYRYNKGRYEIVNALDSSFIMSPYVSYLVQSAKDIDWSISPTIEKKKTQTRSSVVRDNVSKYQFELSKNNALIDKTQVIFNSMAESRYVINEDATKMVYNKETHLWTETNGEIFGINQLPPVNHGEQITLKAYISDAGTFQINRLTSNGDYSHIMIRQSDTNEQATDLLSADYSLSASSNETKTFEVTFLFSPTSVVDGLSNRFSIYSEGEYMMLRGAFEKIEIFSVNGEKITTLIQHQERIALPKGIYMVRVSNDDQQQTLKYKH